MLTLTIVAQAAALVLSGVMLFGLAAHRVEPRLVWTAGLFTALIGVCVLGLTWSAWSVQSRRMRAIVDRVNHDLDREVRLRIAESLELRNALIVGLATLAEYRDTDTGAHLDRIGAYAELLARALMGTHGEIDEAWIRRLRAASSLHDIGKVGIPDAILLKPGPLTAAERRTMERHPDIAADTLRTIMERVGGDEFLEMALHIAHEHHERWDGSGYPVGRAGAEIALEARIVALADVYDAMTSARVYKPARSHEETAAMIERERGKHFDPEVVDAFVRVAGQFDAIRRTVRDEHRVLPERCVTAA